LNNEHLLQQSASSLPSAQSLTPSHLALAGTHLLPVWQKKWQPTVTRSYKNVGYKTGN